MNKGDLLILRKLIQESQVISFDVFDTLLLRKVNTPETVFDIVGKQFGIVGFRKLRMDAQNEASQRIYSSFGYPHANLDDIYCVLKDNSTFKTDWDLVKECELQVERDSLVANDEIKEIYDYAISAKKRIIATSDMYIPGNFILEILHNVGYKNIDFLYISSDEHKAKFNKELFITIKEKENCEWKEILHIGDNRSADVKIPNEFGIKTFLYKRENDIDKIKDLNHSEVDQGIYNILCNSKKSFWYKLGVEIAGPLYMGLLQWLESKINSDDNSHKKIYFLSRDGYNLYKIFKEIFPERTEYLFTSRRALLMAGITRMDEADIELLPPYTFGQSIKEILDYLCVSFTEIQHLSDTGFQSFDDVINTVDDINSFKKLYVLDKEAFLKRCENERFWAKEYFAEKGFLDAESLVFDCGWSGSSQFLLDKFIDAINNEIKSKFYYVGIFNTDKSRKQLHGKSYETYLFDFFKNYSLQQIVNQAVVVSELFFTAHHPSVFIYGSNGVVFEEGEENKEKKELLQGIIDYLDLGLDFVKKYNIFYDAEIAFSHLQRLIVNPSVEEAILIGNIDNVDGFARTKGEKKCIAYVTDQQLRENPNIEIYWPKGLLVRPDIAESIKRKTAIRFGLDYPKRKIQKYNLEDETEFLNYQLWIAIFENEIEKKRVLSYNPKFSVVIPVYNTATYQLRDCILSVLNQTYENFELILIDDCSSWNNVRPILRKFEKSKKVKVIYRKENGHISKATNDGISVASGDFIAFMDCDDTISKDALYCFAEKLNENKDLDFIYSDEDKLTEDGKIRHLPFFKPDWSPDLFLSMMYTNHLAVYRTSLVQKIGGLRSAYNGAQDYDMTLRFLEVTENSRVAHIPKVLYHWRERSESIAFSMDSKNYATEAACRAKEDALRRRKITGHMETIIGIFQHRVLYEVEGNPLVSIIIPSKENPEVLFRCINSIRCITAYHNYEIIIVDNGSSINNKRIIEKFLATHHCKYIYDLNDFNFSHMCNLGAKSAQGNLLLFLNDDIEIFQADWLERIIGQAQQEHVGAVGIKLFYPETTLIQHAGISNLEKAPGHTFYRLNDNNTYYFAMNRVDYDCLAVTGACLLIDKEKFILVGGFDENLAVSYNDIDLCFKLYEQGYYNVLRNDVVAYHHESLSRGADNISEEKMFRLEQEKKRLYIKHPKLKGKDPFYNPNFGNCINFNLPLVQIDNKPFHVYSELLLVKALQMIKAYGIVYVLKKIKTKVKNSFKTT